MNIVEEFKKIRDIPYKIPLSPDETDECCSGKSIMLHDIFKSAGYGARYRICSFLWSSIDLPSNVTSTPHDDNSTHQYLEIKIGDDWKIVDPTWDKGLGSTFPVNDWDGKSDTRVAVSAIKTFSPEESVKYIEKFSTDEETLSDLKINGDFYRAFNEWLVKIRFSNKSW